jgi:hypothetical protein
MTQVFEVILQHANDPEQQQNADGFLKGKWIAIFQSAMGLSTLANNV